MSADFDVAIVGSGFAGSLMAILARRLGRSVVLIERGRHPRFAIGESSTPLSNLLLEELADRFGLPWLRAFSKWGTWQATHPEVACGLKRGFSFFHHRDGEAWSDDADRSRQLLVAASPNDAVADTHWHRPDFDLFLQRKAVEAGCEYQDETRLDQVERDGDAWELSGEASGGPFRCRARWILDASGPDGFLHRQLGLEAGHFQGLPATTGIWSHFTGVHRWETLFPGFQAAPFTPDDAALHHLFDGGWMWVLRFNNDVTSAGFALTPEAAASRWNEDPEAMWNGLMDRLPSVSEAFRSAARIQPFQRRSPLPFRSRSAIGPGWIQLPMAAGFIDPLFSTGFVLSLLGIERLCDWMEAGEPQEGLDRYGVETLADLDATADLVGAAYRTLGDPESFEALSMLYFAAASFSECARRLGKPGLAPGFLLRSHPRFGPDMRGCLLAAGRAPSADLAALVADAVRPFNVAGLCDRTKRGWYPVSSADLLQAADALESDPDAIRTMLRRTGFDG